MDSKTRQIVVNQDLTALSAAEKSYGDSWKKRGGVGAFMTLARKWDRLENKLKTVAWDIFHAIKTDQRSEGIVDDIRDLRRYLILVEAEAAGQGYCAPPLAKDTPPDLRSRDTGSSGALETVSTNFGPGTGADTEEDAQRRAIRQALLVNDDSDIDIDPPARVLHTAPEKTCPPAHRANLRELLELLESAHRDAARCEKSIPHAWDEVAERALQVVELAREQKRELLEKKSSGYSGSDA